MERIKPETDLLAIRNDEALFVDEGLDGAWTTALTSQEGHYLSLSDERIYPKVKDLKLMSEAYYRFMTDGGTLQEIAADMDIVQRTVFKWADVGGWVARRQSIEDVPLDQEKQLIDRRLLEKREEVLTQQLATGESLMSQVKKQIEAGGQYKPNELKLLGDSFKSVAEVQLKALGMDGKEGMARRADRDEGSGGKTPLVIVVKGAGLPDIRQSGDTTVVEV